MPAWALALGLVVASVVAPQIVSAQTAPTIAAQPRAPLSLTAGGNLIMGAALNGTGPFYYQWRFNGAPLAGQTNALLFRPLTTTNHSGNYDLIVSNLVGSVTSAVATVTVKARPETVALVTWGYGNNRAVPPSNYVALASGLEHILILKNDGTILADGRSGEGEINVPASATNIVAVAASSYGSLALRADGVVFAWGQNDTGQTTVPTGLSNVVAVSGSHYAGLALRRDGTVVNWGNVATPAGLSNIVAISGAHTALTADGRVIIWDDVGNLSPTTVTNAVAVSDGDAAGRLALLADGTVVSFGNSYFDQPFLPAGLSNVVAVAAGRYHSLALKTDGTVVAWGAGANGQIKPYPHFAQATIPQGLTNVFAINAGPVGSVALMSGSPALVLDDYHAQIVSTGGNAKFNIRAAGSEPFTWHWRFNGVDIPSASGGSASAFYPSLTLSNVSSANVGNYTLVAANFFGSTTSAPVTLILNTGLPGSVDPTFNPGTGASGLAHPVIQPGGKILIYGEFTSFTRKSLARLNADGSLDTSFVHSLSEGDANRNYLTAVVVQADGKILIAGSFTNIGIATRTNVARLNTDGSLDTSFAPVSMLGSGGYSAINAMALQPDGKVLIGGYMTDVNGVLRSGIARLNTNGTLDASFNPGAGISGGQPEHLNAIALQPDGKIVIGGRFQYYDSAIRGHIARVNSDGSVDPTFTTANNIYYVSQIVNSIAIQTDGKIVIGGPFGSVNNVSRNYIARLNADGTLDISFDPGSGANNTVDRVLLQPDGKILISGEFTKFNGVDRRSIARVNFDGSLDMSFDIGSNNGGTGALALQPDGKILVAIGGDNVDGYPRYGIARLNNGPFQYPAPVLTTQGSGSITRLPDITNYVYGQIVTLTAVPGRYYAFKQWSDGATNNLRAITIGTSNYFTAIFTNTVPLETLMLKQWEQTYGANGRDILRIVRQTSDGGFILGGIAASGTSPTKTTTRGGFWIVKVDSDGNRQWDQSYGLEEATWLTELQPTRDGGYIIGGYSEYGIVGDKTTPNYGSRDFWIVKIDANGLKQWEQDLGGSGDDVLSSIRQTPDGGYFIEGASNSDISGNKTTVSLGGRDRWVVRLDNNGNKLSEQIFPNARATDGNNLYPTCTSLTRDGGYLLAVAANAGVSGIKTSPGFNNLDYWVVRYDANGVKLWDQTYGGNNHDMLLTAALPTSDGGFLLGGRSDSGIEFVKTSPEYGNGDYWLVKIDGSGVKQWDQSFGGSGIEGGPASPLYYRMTESGASLKQAGDGGYFVAGYSTSGSSGNKTTPNYGTNDGWVFKLDANGVKQSDMTFGGTNDDGFSTIELTSDGGFILGGFSRSDISGNKTSTNYGGYDYWLVKAFAREAPVGTPLILVNGFFGQADHHRIINTNAVSVAITSTILNAHIYYTLDGAEPDFDSTEYSGPFVVAASAQLRAAAYDANYIQAGDTVINFVDFIPYYTITNATPGGGAVSFDPPVGPYLSNSLVTLSATASPGWTFARWGGDVAGTNNPTLLTVNGNKSVKAVFVTGLFGVPSPALSGALLFNPPDGVYAYGQSVLLSAIPAAGKYFLKWSVPNYGSNSPLLITITNVNQTNNAQFSTLTGNNRTLTLQINGPGFVSKSPLAGFYSDGATVTVTATPDPGYVFIGWSGNAAGTQNPLAVVMTTNKTIAANFSIISPPQNIPPGVTITNPLDGAVFTAPANVTINGAANDIDGTITQVALFAGTNVLGTTNQPFFSFIWTNAPLGTNILTAVATDNGGLSTTSAPVIVTMSLPPPGPPVFSLSASTYQVVENGGSVVVTVLKSFNSLADTVNYTTANGSAVAVSGGLGDYQATSGSLNFTNGEPSKTVTIPIVNDFSYEGNQSFSFLLSVSGGGGSLGTPSAATITIIDDDSPASTNSFLENAFPAAVPAHDGQLRVSIEPVNAGGQWRLTWETAWRNSGDTIAGLPSGNYPVTFKPVAGFLPPADTLNPVTSGSLNWVTNTYAGSGTTQSGLLTVTIQPSAVAGALNEASRGQWRLQGESNWYGSGFVITNLIAGEQIVEFKTIADWITPAPRIVNVGADQENSIGATYLIAQSSGATPPSVLQFSDATSAAFGLPYAYGGQLLSDVGYGSGTVVKKRVVLTAAHVVFNDATLSYVTSVQWFFQRYAGQYEPAAQTPRGWYVFGGYAAARTNDNSPGVSSPASQNLDVATLYFLEDAGRGGQSGYLVSDPVGTEWLQASALKTLVGYPVETVSDINRGRMHATTPGNISFDLVTNRVFSTTAIRGYPGNSGGPVCVQFTNGTYYPAAVYLGGSAETIVRAIDGAVADLINRADVTANTGDNNTGGGPIRIEPGQGGGGTVGYVQVKLGPPAALAAGAGWRLEGSSGFSSVSNFTVAVTTNSGITVEFKPVAGWHLPPARTNTVTLGQTTIILAFYSVTNPILSLNPSTGLGMTGTTGTTYLVQFRTNLTVGSWLPFKTNTLGPGLNAIMPWPPTNSPAGFYRALWLR